MGSTPWQWGDTEFSNQERKNASDLANAKLTSNLFNMGTSAMNLFSMDINANILQGNFEAYELGAESIELQAIERANQLRENFSKTVGDYVAMATQRNVKVSSGSVQDNIQASAGNMAEDIATTEANAKAKANSMRLKAKAQKAMQGVNTLTGYSNAFAYASKIKL